jgi:rhodanese-related sulfurtransferase
MLPIDTANLAPWINNGLALLVGLGFGAALESSGFGDSRRLAAQFYGRDMTVLNVMFTAIITAAVLIVLGSALGWVDFSRLYVNPTYLWPQIVGGLVMGVGFIVGGFCPGTSLVASATGKVDGMVFLAGVAAGILAFGESVQGIEGFFESGYFGRFTLGDWLGIDLGWALLGVVLMALLMFWGGEIAQDLLGRGKSWAEVRLLPSHRLKLAGAGLLLVLSLAAVLVGQPDPARRWAVLGKAAQPLLDSRAVHVSVPEVVEVRANPALNVVTLDVRGEREFNLFHLRNAERVTAGTHDPDLLRRLTGLAPNTAVFVIGNGETAAVQAWKELWAQGVPNLYIVEGGINAWLREHPLDPCLAAPLTPAPADPDALAWAFTQSVGDAVPAAHPECPDCKDEPRGCEKAAPAKAHAPAKALPYPHKVKLKAGAKAKGGCG